MNIGVKEYKAKLITETSCTLEIASVLRELVVYKLTFHYDCINQGEFLISHPGGGGSREGITYQHNIDSFLARTEAYENVLSITDDSIKSGWVFFTKESRDYIAQNPFDCGTIQGKRIISNATIERPYTSFMRGEVTKDDLVLVKNSLGMLLDSNLDPLPVGIYMDYINGDLNNKMYDLKKAFQILKFRTDIKFMNPQGHYINPNKSSVFFNIPYHNKQEGMDKCMYIVWTPSPKQMKMLLEECRKLFSRPKKSSFGKTVNTSPFIHRHDVIFELDLLGLRAGGAVIYNWD